MPRFAREKVDSKKQRRKSGQMTNEFVNDEKGWNSNKQSDAQKNIRLDICQKSYRRHCSGGHGPDDRITSMLSRGKFSIVGTEEFTSGPDCSKI
jgi:hypothetical protein